MYNLTFYAEKITIVFNLHPAGGVEMVFCSWILTISRLYHHWVTKLSDISWFPVIFKKYLSFYHGPTTPSGPKPLHYRGITITFVNTTIGRIPLDEWSSRRRIFYLTINENHKRQTSMPPAGFETTVPASERPQTHATGIPRWHIKQDRRASF